LIFQSREVFSVQFSVFREEAGRFVGGNLSWLLERGGPVSYCRADASGGIG
jgi:hypothetical protein